MTQVTCQICGRAIKAKNGVIAHHGYTRPDYGWQTASCFGARHLPYEVSREAIPLAINHNTAWISATEEVIIRMFSEPPASLRTSGDAWGNKKVERPRPDNFDPESNTLEARMRNSYNDLFNHVISQKRQAIKSAKENIAYLQKRFDDWRAQV